MKTKRLEHHHNKKLTNSSRSAYSASNAPFFILGCARSGTSLLSRMLNHHPNLAVPSESHLFNTFYPWLKYYGNLSVVKNRRRLVNDILSTDIVNDWKPRLDREQVIAAIKVHDFGGVVDAIMCSWAKMQHKNRWGEKTPHHLFYWKEISQFFPNAKIVHIVRDGRDVALSFLNARFGPKTIYRAAKFWVDYLGGADQLKNEIEPAKICEIHYEDLLESPESTLTLVCRFLNEPFVSEMLEFYKNDALYPTDIHNRENLRRPLLRDNKLKWCQNMSFKDLRIFEAVGHHKLEQYGYQLSNSQPTLSRTERIYREYIASIPPKALAMLKNTKGHREAWIRFRIQMRLKFWDSLRLRN